MRSTLVDLLSALHAEGADPRLAAALARLDPIAPEPSRFATRLGSRSAGAQPHSRSPRPPRPPGGGRAARGADAGRVRLSVTRDGDDPEAAARDAVADGDDQERELLELVERAVRLAYEYGLRASGSADPALGATSLTGLVRVFDLLVEGVMLLRSDLRVAYMNSALTRALGEDDGRDEILLRMRQLAGSLVGPAAAARENPSTTAEVHTAQVRYRLRASCVDGELGGVRCVAAVTLERLTPRLPTATALKEQFGLTPGEARVALLLVQGYSNGAIAARLRISPHTARHHTQSILFKLGIHTRTEVAPKLLGTSRGTSRSPRPTRVV